MQLYRLTVATILQRKVWVVALLLLLLLPTVLPNIMAYNVSLIQPAQAQAAWVGLWLITMTWIFFQGARFGEDASRSGLGAYFLSLGHRKTSQLFQLALACYSFLLPMILLTVGLCLFVAKPADATQVEMWVVLNLQYALLFIAVVAPLLLLSISLGSRLGATVGYLVPLALILYGLYGVNHISTLANGNNVILDWLYVFSPHYHLADLTERLIFMQGSMVQIEFLQIFSYFVGVGLVTVVVSIICFRVQPAG